MSWMTVKVKSKKAWHGGSTKSAGFAAVHNKTVDFLG
jgi:hypothetical protein